MTTGGTDSTPINYLYFNNDAEAFAVSNAITLRDYLQNASLRRV